MQADINRIVEWCETWSMDLSSEKCIDNAFRESKWPKILFHCRSKNPYNRWWVLVFSDSKCHEQVCSAASKANRVLELMKSTFSCLSDDIARLIYPTFIRPHLEFASSVWNLYLKNESNTLERVKRRATLTRESYHLIYHERLERLGLTDLSSRREKGNFTQNYKIVRGLEKLN